jgi:hypothetical protein
MVKIHRNFLSQMDKILNLKVGNLKILTHVELDKITINAPFIYTAPCIMFWMRVYPLRGQVGGGWALEFESFLGPVKWHRADRRVPFGPKKLWGLRYGYARIQNIMHRAV